MVPFLYAKTLCQSLAEPNFLTDVIGLSLGHQSRPKCHVSAAKTTMPEQDRFVVVFTARFQSCGDLAQFCVQGFLGQFSSIHMGAQ